MAITTVVFGYPAPGGKPVLGIPQSTSYTPNGFTQDVTGTTFPLQTGVPLSPNYTFSVVPAETGTVNSNRAVCPTYTFSGTSGAPIISINTTNTMSSTPGSVAIPVLTQVKTGPNGLPCVFLDCERNLVFTFGQSSTGTNGTLTTNTEWEMVIQGWDYRGVPMTISSGGVPTTFAPGAQYVISNQLAIVSTVYFNVNPYGSQINNPGANAYTTVCVGIGTQIGLPYYLADKGFVSNVFYNGEPLRAAATAANQGAFSIGAAGSTWRNTSAANLQNVGFMSAQYMNSSTRGYIELDTVAGGQSTGSAALIVQYYVQGADSEFDANLANLNPGSLALLGSGGVLYITPNPTLGNPKPTPVPVWPGLTQYDLVGMQWNAFVTDIPVVNGFGGEIFTPSPKTGDNAEILAYAYAQNSILTSVP